MSLSDLFKQVFTFKGVDPLIDILIDKWEKSLNSTLSKITKENEGKAIENLSILIKVLGDCKVQIKRASCTRIKDSLQEVTNIIMNSFLGYQVPVLISNLKGYLIKVPYEDDLDFIINAGSAKPFCASHNYYALPHEIGHLIFHLECKNISQVQSISSQLSKIMKNLAMEIGLDQGKASDITSIWSLWINELIADIFALSILGPSYVYYWIQGDTGSISISNPKLGSEKYPPENLRTNWMIRKLKLGRFRNQYDFQGERKSSDLVPIIKKYKESKEYNMEDEFWSDNQISEREREKWRDFIFCDSIFDVITDIADGILQKIRLDISLENLSESINSLKSEKKPQSNLLVSFAALLEVWAYKISTVSYSKLMTLKNIDELLY